MLSPDQAWPPDYSSILTWRQQVIAQMLERPELISGAKDYYRSRPIEFIEHWCDTYDPRNVGTDRPAWVPFILFKRQKELIQFIQACRVAKANGLIEKSRDMGATWLCGSYCNHQWLFEPDFTAGWGSRKAELVDELGVLDSIFEKMRAQIRRLPAFFLPQGFRAQDHLMYMRMLNPENGSTITGECGDNIGRGGRKTIYFKDESAHYEHPESIEAALDNNTDVQIDMSSVHGLGTVFHRKREAGIDWEPGQPAIRGSVNVLVLDWRDHPEKDQAWYETKKQEKEDAGLLHLFYQEVDRNYAASVEGIIIDPAWVEACIDAHKKLGFTDDGMWTAALDVADSGGDRNAITARKGVVLKNADEWGAPDTGVTARKAIEFVRPYGKVDVQYDCIGVGAGVKAEANRLAAERLMPSTVRFIPWDAGSSPLFPERRVVERDRQSPLNKDFYANLKAQGWWQLRLRAERTAKCVREGKLIYPVDQLMSIDSKIPKLRQIQKELSQPVRKPPSGRMKLVIDKMTEGMRSPNLGDSIMMNYWPVRGYDASQAWVG